MLVTFHTKAYADITMFGDVAVRLIKMMGLSGTVPSALMAEDVPRALATLKAAVARADAQETAAQGREKKDEEMEPPVSTTHRALPLIDLLQAAAADKRDVMWDKG